MIGDKEKPKCQKCGSTNPEGSVSYDNLMCCYDCHQYSFETRMKLEKMEEEYRREIKNIRDACGVIGHIWKTDEITTEKYCVCCLFSDGRYEV